MLTKAQCPPPRKTPKVMTGTSMTTRVEVSGREYTLNTSEQQTGW